MLYSLRALTVATSFRICYKLKPITPYLKRQCALLHTSSLTGGTSTRFQNPRRRKGNKPGKALLAKFVKHLSHDGGMLENMKDEHYTLEFLIEEQTQIPYLVYLYCHFPMSVCVFVRPNTSIF